MAEQIFGCESYLVLFMRKLLRSPRLIYSTIFLLLMTEKIKSSFTFRISVSSNGNIQKLKIVPGLFTQPQMFFFCVHN